MTASGSLAGTTIVRPLVLLVDDEPAVVHALTALLAPRLEPWFRVVSAGSLSEALELLDSEDDRTSPLALAISDEKMPGGAGTELLVRLRTRPSHIHGGRIVVTGYADLDSAKRAINDAEVDRYYPKPWDADGALLPAVGEILAAFSRKRGMDRVQVITANDWPAARKTALALRRSWWEYVHLMGMSADEMGVAVPDLAQAADAGARHLVLEEWSPGERLALCTSRLVVNGTKAAVEDVAFLPGAATDGHEALVLRMARLEAWKLGARALTVQGTPLREEFYGTQGFIATSPEGEMHPEVSPTVEWSATLSSDGDAWAARHARERRLCACAQTDCPSRDYALTQRSYFCPLDLIERRIPRGFPEPRA